ncbi:uncharacterized protein LOC108666360 [Hyalella azteca]|uniref:Uncharacterized protein LOC108666360 n=1 Tax=Hyalella azteca TaxID=294128 RepID=A0A8B7N603_HYAAZ|nr:uncharacterized protein LOC108666360 [Hyalella azteca]
MKNLNDESENMENQNDALAAVLAVDPWSLQATGVTSLADDTSRLCLVTEPDAEGERDVLGLRPIDSRVVVSGHLYFNYKRVKNIGRCLHLDDALISWQLKCLVPHHLFNHRSDELLNTTVLWSEPVRDACFHNKFGNVTFTVAWSDMYRLFGPNMYYLHQRIARNFLTTEILVTKKHFSSLRPVDFEARNAPVRIGPDKSLEYATVAQGAKSSLKHRIYIAFDATFWEGFWVYKVSTKISNEHQFDKFCFRERCITHRFCQYYLNVTQVDEIFCSMLNYQNRPR